ncbi:MAG TPA: SIR2 family protein [Candidatus Elarobacter sp.]|jgi:tetratricopeptide (TPR) repeat protein|nr:SIR2 family protein [Candidatus Elarobacter sp.]
MSIAVDRIIPLTEALRRLALVQASMQGGERNPFFFIVGSGISTPAIKTAAGIVADCRAQFSDSGQPCASSAEEYSYWFSRAYPEPVARQRYLARLIDEARVTQATLSLAHLLIESSLAKLVITPNFDDLLTRSLALFGATPLICDHPSTAGRIDPESEAIQVVHVHGSHYFYDLANLKVEIKQRARRGTREPPSIPQLLQRVLWDRSPLVFGYAGWPEDVIMTTLEERLRTRNRLKRNLYWFCYRPDAINKLPPWLRNHPNVYFVVADAARSEPTNTPSEKPNPKDRTVAPATQNQLLPADVALSALITKLKLNAPKLTVSPIGFFHDQIAAQLQDAVDEAKERDRYVFSEMLGRIRKAAQNEERALRLSKDYAKFIDAARRSAHAEMAALAQALASERDLTVAQLREVQRSLEEATASALLTGDDNADVKVEMLKALDKVLARITDEDRECVDKVNLVGRRIGVALKMYDLRKLDEEMAIYDDVAGRYGNARDSELRALAVRALEYKGNTLSTPVGEHTRALALFEYVERTYGDDTAPAVVDAVAEVCIARAYAMREANQDSRDLLRHIIDRYRDGNTEQQDRMTARAMNALGFVRYEAHDIAGELDVRRELEEFTRGRPGLHLERLRNFREIAATLFLQGSYEESLRTLSDATRELGEEPRDEERTLLAEYLHWEARAERAMDRSEDAVAALRRLIALSVPASNETIALVERAYRDLFGLYAETGPDRRRKRRPHGARRGGGGRPASREALRRARRRVRRTRYGSEETERELIDRVHPGRTRVTRRTSRPALPPG